MEYLYYHCQNCTRDDDDDDNILNITCVGKIKEYINSNILTIVRYNFNCKNCEKILGFYNCNKHIVTKSLYINNFKLIETYGLFQVLFSRYNEHYYKSYSTIKNDWISISEVMLYDLIKDGSLITVSNVYDNYYCYSRTLKKFHFEEINNKGYYAEFIRRVFDTSYYIIKKHALTKPAIK